MISYDWFKADGYGNVCIDGKHYYSTKPEYHGQKVLAGKRAHFVDILNPDGSLLVRHKRMYGDIRTDVIDYATTLAVLSRNAGAWQNSGLRKELPDPLREYLDRTGETSAERTAQADERAEKRTMATKPLSMP